MYLQANYNRIRNFRATAKVKHELFNQRGEQAADKRDRSFFGADHQSRLHHSIGADLTIWPKWKSTFRREVPTDPSQANTRELEETLFLISRYAILEQTWIALGLEFSWFEELARPASRAASRLYRGLYQPRLFNSILQYVGLFGLQLP